MAQMGMAYGRDFVRGSMAQYMPGAATLWQSLRYYFDVNNTYVVRKLGVSDRCPLVLPNACLILTLSPRPSTDSRLPFHQT
jgi:hypothetical protein